jgi:hypothetical protein
MSTISAFGYFVKKSKVESSPQGHIKKVLSLLRLTIFSPENVIPLQIGLKSSRLNFI